MLRHLTGVYIISGGNPKVYHNQHVMIWKLINLVSLFLIRRAYAYERMCFVLGWDSVFFMIYGGSDER